MSSRLNGTLVLININYFCLSLKRKGAGKGVSQHPALLREKNYY